MDYGGKNKNLDYDIQGIHLGSEVNRWMDVAEKVNACFNFVPGHFSYSHHVINVAKIQ